MGLAVIGALARRVQLMIGRCVIRAIEADGGRVLVTIDGLEGEATTAAELVEPWGLTSVPVAGAEGLRLSVMGERGNPVVLPFGDRRSRPRDLKPGESSLHDDRGHRVDILRDRIRFTTPDLLEIIAPSATINGEAIATVTHEVEVQFGSSSGRHPIVTGVGDGG